MIVVESDSAFTPAQLGEAAALKGKLEALQAGSTVIGPIPSEDAKAVQFVVPIASSAEVKTVVKELRNEVRASAPAGMQTFVTGPAGLTADLVSAFAGIDGILLLVALGAVFLILLIVYRSLLLPVVVLFTSVFALCAAILLVFGMAKAGWIQLNGQSQGILSILVIGAATDYALLYVARFREALTHTTNRTAAAAHRMEGGLGTDPGLRRHRNHRAALPAVLRPQLQQGPRPGGGGGHPLRALRRPDPAAGPDGTAGPGRVLAVPAQAAPGNRAGTGTGHRPRGPEGTVAGHRFARIPPAAHRLGRLGAAAPGGLLPASCSSRPTASPQTDVILTASNAVDGQDALGRHFDAGSGSPAVIVADEAKAQEVLAKLQTSDGVGDAYLLAEGGAPIITAAPRALRLPPQCGTGRS